MWRINAEFETGIIGGNEVEVVRGLKAGERIVTSGAYAMEDGTKVAIVSPDKSEDVKPDTNKPGGN